jgi:hypothetical protein
MKISESQTDRCVYFKSPAVRKELDLWWSKWVISWQFNDAMIEPIDVWALQTIDAEMKI